MKTKTRIQTALLLAALLAPSSPAAEIFERPAPASPDAIRVVSANLRQLFGAVDNDTTDDPNVWEKRKHIVRDTLIAQKADIICFQECRQAHLDYLKESMPGLTHYALQVPYGSSFRPTNPTIAILYSTTRLELLESDGFYLSDIPRALQSAYPESLSVRLANWARFKDKKTSRVIKVWNTHLDHLASAAGGAELRGKQIAVLLNATACEPDDSPQILTGDFNSQPVLTPDYAVYNQLTALNGWTDTWTETGNAAASHPTSNPSFAGATTGAKIDYIMRKGKLRATRAEIITDYRTVDGTPRYPSDHYFVSADLEYDTTTGPIPEPASFVSTHYRSLTDPAGLAIDNSGNLYIADEYQHTIKRAALSESGTAIPAMFAGAGAAGLIDNPRGALALLNNPRSLALQNGSLVVADSGNKMLRLVDLATTAVTRLAGVFSHGPATAADGGPDTARFALPASVVTAPDGAIYIADSDASAIRKIAPDGTVTTLAGALGSSGSDDGLGGSARFNEPLGLAIDPAAQYLYVADTGNHTIRKIALANASVTTLAGAAGVPGAANGPAAAARFNSPAALAYYNGALYIADTLNHAIRAVDANSGATQTLAGTPGFEMPIVGMTKVLDGPPAEALFSHPTGIIAAPDGNLYVADTGNAAIRRIDLSGGATTTTLFVGSSTTSMTGHIVIDGEDGGAIGPTNPAGPTGPSHAGGGAISPWCLLALALLALTRRTRTRSAGRRACPFNLSP